MATLITAEAVNVEYGASQPWPQDIVLYTPKSSQLLLPDECHCESVKVFLTLSSVAFTVEERGNAEFMSPSGQVPFIRVGSLLISEVDPIFGFISDKTSMTDIIPDDLNLEFKDKAEQGYFTGYQLSSQLTNEERADMKAYMSLVEHVMGCAELYVTWCCLDTYKTTRLLYSSIFSPPLGHLMVLRKYWQVRAFLKAKGWFSKDLAEVEEEFENTLTVLSDRLGGEPHFYSHGPTELDSLLYSHLSCISKSRPPNILSCAVARNEVMMRYLQNMETIVNSKRMGK